MLVLARKVGQRIMVGQNIILAVVSIEKGIVRLGIEAPQDVVIAREEVSDLYNGRPLDHGDVGKRYDTRGAETRMEHPAPSDARRTNCSKDGGKTDGATGSQRPDGGAAIGPGGERPVAEGDNGEAGDGDKQR